jgi:hypothetical protein
MFWSNLGCVMHRVGLQPPCMAFFALPKPTMEDYIHVSRVHILSAAYRHSLLSKAQLSNKELPPPGGCALSTSHNCLKALNRSSTPFLANSSLHP